METKFDVELKVNKQAIVVDLSKVDDTWLAHCLQYGVRRFINDSHSGLEGQTKWEACMLFAKDMMAGEVMPEKVRRSSGGTARNPVEALAFKNAKAALTVVFKQLTGFGKAVDFATHEKVKPFFVVKDDKATWNDATVQKWMEAQAKAGKVDYMADAKATLDGAEAAVADLEF